LSPFSGSTVEPIVTSFVNFLRIDVESKGLASADAEALCELGSVENAVPFGATPPPPQAEKATREAAKTSRPAFRSSMTRFPFF
jgi:hypothetical protein